MSPVVTSERAPTGYAAGLIPQGFCSPVTGVTGVTSMNTHMRTRTRAHAHTPARLALVTPVQPVAPVTAGSPTGRAVCGHAESQLRNAGIKISFGFSWRIAK